jgi:hypothetical protein
MEFAQRISAIAGAKENFWTRKLARARILFLRRQIEIYGLKMFAAKMELSRLER